MKRDALRLFLRRLVLASLPLGGLAGCGQPAAAADASADLDGGGLVDASGPGDIGAWEMWCSEGQVSGLVRRDLGDGPDGTFTETDWVRLPYDDSDGRHHFTRRRAGRAFGELGSGTLPWYRSA